jgi:hypothetical protein
MKSQGDEQRRAGAEAVTAEGLINMPDGETAILLPLYPSPANADAARWEGVLGLKGRCLVITGDGSAAAFAVPVFPEGRAQWDNEARVLTFNGKRYAIGDRIVVGGSFNNLGRPGLPAIRDLSPDCPGDSVWLVG